jgi:hypothetical protein
MKHRNDPFQVFRYSKTPAGLYARQKWLGEAERSQWKIDYQETVSDLLAAQSADGSWRQETIATIKHLFGLHLTVQSSNAQIETALAWLLKSIEIQAENDHVSAENVVRDDDLRGLPFVPSRPAILLTGATLFLATIFGRQNDPDVLAVYQFLGAEGAKNKGLM